MNITKDMTIADIISANPKAAEVFEKYGLHCAHCELGKVETLEEGAKGHGLTEKEVEEMVERINKN